jgi:hypothetical protein
MPNNDEQRQKICDLLTQDENDLFDIKNCDFSNLKISYKFISSDIDFIDFTNTRFFSIIIR